MNCEPKMRYAKLRVNCAIVLVGACIILAVLCTRPMPGIRLMSQTQATRSVRFEQEQSFTVCTYFEKLPGQDEKYNKAALEILEAWKESWSKLGWKTKVLTEEDARLHPQYQKIKATLLKLPTVNPKDYEMACYLRWVAAAAAGCKVRTHAFKQLRYARLMTFCWPLMMQWMADTDMINFGLPPQGNWIGPKLHSFEGIIPSLVTGSTEAFESILKIFLRAAEDPVGNEIVIHNGKNHTSDMIILAAHRDAFIDLKYPARLTANNPAINDSVLLHFSTKDTNIFTGRRLTKGQFARTFRGGHGRVLEPDLGT